MGLDKCFGQVQDFKTIVHIITIFIVLSFKVTKKSYTIFSFLWIYLYIVQGVRFKSGMKKI